MSVNRTAFLSGAIGAFIGTPAGLLTTVLLAWLIGRRSASASQVSDPASRETALHLVADDKTGSAS